MEPLISKGRRWMIPVLAALALGLGFVGVALSGDRSDSPGTRAATDSGREHVKFFDYLADELGVSNERLLLAAQGAADRTLDDLVAGGKLTADQASAIRTGLTRLAADPRSLEEVLRSARRDAAPYRSLFRRVHTAVSEAVASELNVEARQLGPLARRGRLDDAARRAGASGAQIRAAARAAAQPALRRAVSEGSITRLQARLAIHKTLSLVTHLISH